MTVLIDLNIDGTIISISKKVLLRKESKLTQLFNKNNLFEKDVYGRFIIETKMNYFQIILNWLEDKPIDLAILKKHELNELFEVCLSLKIQEICEKIGVLLKKREEDWKNDFMPFCFDTNSTINYFLNIKKHFKNL